MGQVMVVYDFVRFSLFVLIEFTKDVLSKMTGNTYLTDADPPWSYLSATAGELELTMINYKADNTSQVLMMRNVAAKLLESLRKEASCVERIANGDEAIIRGSGFHTETLYARNKRPDFWVLAGANSGEVILGRKIILNAGAYIWQYSLKENPVNMEDWINAGVSTQLRWYISGLESGKSVWFRCCGVTNKGTTPWCEPVCKVIP